MTIETIIDENKSPISWLYFKFLYWDVFSENLGPLIFLYDNLPIKRDKLTPMNKTFLSSYNSNKTNKTKIILNKTRDVRVISIE